MRDSQFLQGDERFFRAIFLRKSEQHVEGNDGANCDAVAVVSEKYGNGGGRKEDKHHEGGQLLPNDQPRALEPASFQFVASVGGKSFCGLLGGQAYGCVGLEYFKDDVRFQFIPLERGARGPGSWLKSEPRREKRMEYRE